MLNDRCSNIWASLPGAGYTFEHKADSLIAKLAWAERSERLMYEQSHRDYLALVILHHRLPVIMLIITVITPLPTKPSATKMPENCAGESWQLLTCRCVSVMLLRSMQKIHEGVSWMPKLKMMLCVMMLPLVVVGCTSKQSVSQCVKQLPPPAWIMQPPDWQTPLNGIISPSERG